MAEALTTSQKSTNVRATPWQLLPVRAAFRLLCPTFPGLAARWAVRLFRTVRPFPRPEREEGWLAGARPLRLPAGDTGAEGRSLAAWSWGEETSPTVLLVHGWEGRGSQMGAFAAPLVERGFRVVTYDAPGHGDSGGRLSSLPETAAAVSAAARELGPLAGVVAHSFGVAATCYGLMTGSLPDHLAGRLVFVAPPGDLHHYIRYTADLLGLTPEVEERFVTHLEERFGVDWAQARSCTTRAAREIPLLVIADRDDDETPLAEARRVAAAWPGSRFTATAGLGHRRILRAPAVVAEAADFLAADAEGSAPVRSETSSDPGGAYLRQKQHQTPW